MITYEDHERFFKEKYPECDMHSSLVAKIIVRRNELGWDQRALAKKCNLSYRKIKNFENCASKIKIFDLIKILCALALEIKLNRIGGIEII